MIILLEYIKNHFYLAFSFPFIFPDRLNSNLCGAFVRKVEFSRGDTAERYTFKEIFIRKRKARTVAVRKLFFMRFIKSSENHRTDGVYNIPARQIVSRRDFCSPDRLFSALQAHNIVARFSKFHTRESMNGIIDTFMIRIEAPYIIAKRKTQYNYVTFLLSDNRFITRFLF